MEPYKNTCSVVQLESRFVMPYATPIVTKSPLRKPAVRAEQFNIRLETQTVELLELAQRLHQMAYDKMEVSEKVSRNDIIQAFQDWALNAFFADLGGVPASSAEERKAADQLIEKLKAVGAKH